MSAHESFAGIPHSGIPEIDFSHHLNDDAVAGEDQAASRCFAGEYREAMRDPALRILLQNIPADSVWNRLTQIIDRGSDSALRAILQSNMANLNAQKGGLV